MKKQSSTVFLKVVIVLIGIVVLGGLIRFPLTEGRAANLDLFSIYADPVILYLFVGSIPFFVALYQAFKLLGYIGENKVFSLSSVKALRNIKYCAIVIPVLIMVGEAALIITHGGEDDFAGPVALGIFTAFVSIVIAVFAAVLQKLLQSAIDIKAENDLTV